MKTAFALITLVVFARPAQSQTRELNDPLYARQERSFVQAGVPSLWAAVGKTVEIPVIDLDTGVDCNHEDIWRATDASQAKSFADRKPCQDEYGHGTRTSAVIAGQSGNEIGIAGIAGNVRLIPYKIAALLPDGTLTMGDDSVETLVKAFDAIAELPYPLVIVNASTAVGCNSLECFGSDKVRAAIERLQNKALIVAAAGNNGFGRQQGGQDVDAFEHLPCTASNLPNVICVGAVDFEGRLMSSSNFGSKVQIAAPGNWVWTAVPGNQYAPTSGTSIATPFVSGIAALVAGSMLADGASVERVTPATLKQALLAGAKSEPQSENTLATAPNNPAVVDGLGTLTALQKLLAEPPQN